MRNTKVQVSHNKCKIIIKYLKTNRVIYDVCCRELINQSKI